MPIRLNGAPVDERTLRAIAAFILLYVGLLGRGRLGHRDRLGDLRRRRRHARHAGRAASALGNGGPGFGIAGPFGSFAPLGDASKITMIALMWVGRLEIMPVVVLLTRHYWRL